MQGTSLQLTVNNHNIVNILLCPSSILSIVSLYLNVLCCVMDNNNNNLTINITIIILTEKVKGKKTYI